MLFKGLLGKICVGVCGGGSISHFKIKGCEGNACPPTPKLACVLITVACSQDSLTKSNPNSIFLILNPNYVQVQSEIHQKQIPNLGANAFPNSFMATPGPTIAKGTEYRGVNPYSSVRLFNRDQFWSTQAKPPRNNQGE